MRCVLSSHSFSLTWLCEQLSSEWGERLLVSNNTVSFGTLASLLRPASSVLKMPTSNIVLMIVRISYQKQIWKVKWIVKDYGG